MVAEPRDRPLKGDVVDAAEWLRELLAREGPMPLSRFMALALLAPGRGYYATRDPLGAHGDFLTAPEISQCFGELIGAALAQAWLERGAPAPVLLVELGPGRGTLLVDLLRATARVRGFHAALSLHLVEASAALRAVQAERLRSFAPHFHDRLEEVPEGPPLLLVANEFLDALPIRQLVRRQDGWRERLVAVDAKGRIGFLLSPWTVADPCGGNEYPVGTVLELAPAREALVAEAARRVVRTGGLALFIDYAKPGPEGDTLQAVHGHRRVDPFSQPGRVDLSARVDFTALVRAARREGAAVFGPIAQGLFLERLGIKLRLARLLAGKSAELAARLERGVHRLIDPEAMGTLFKVLALSRPDEPIPPGFLASERVP